jgi:predicted nucleic acid-binding protein
MLSGSLPLNPEAKDYMEAAEGLRTYSDQPITLVDALLAGLTHRLKVRVWTFDRHFVTMRANVWRSSACD